MGAFDLHAFLAEMAQGQSPSDREFIALHPVQSVDHSAGTEAQFKGGTTVDNSKIAHSSNATGMVDDIKKTKPKPIDESVPAGYNHRTAGAKGVMHPEFAKHLKVGDHADFYDHGSGDKKYGKVTKNDGKAVHIKHEGTTKRFRVAAGTHGLAEHVDTIDDISERNLQELAITVLENRVKAVTSVDRLAK